MSEHQREEKLLQLQREPLHVRDHDRDGELGGSVLLISNRGPAACCVGSRALNPPSAPKEGTSGHSPLSKPSRQGHCRCDRQQMLALRCVSVAVSDAGLPGQAQDLGPPVHCALWPARGD